MNSTVQKLLTCQPRLRNPDTLFIPHHIRLDDKGLRTSPLRPPFCHKLVDWWTADDGRAHWAHGQVLDAGAQRLLSRAESGRELQISPSSDYQARFYCRTEYGPAALSKVEGKGFAFNILPTGYEWTPASSFTLVFVGAYDTSPGQSVLNYLAAELPDYARATTTNIVNFGEAVYGGESYRYRRTRHFHGALETMIYPDEGDPIIVNRNSIRQANSRLLPSSLYATYRHLVTLGIDYDPETSRFSVLYGDFHTMMGGRKKRGIWSEGALRVKGLENVPFADADDSAYFYELLVFQPRLNVSVRGVRHQYYRGDEFEELYHGYIVPKYQLHRHFVRQYLEKAAVVWPFIRRFPGDTRGLPRLCFGWPMRYSLNRSHSYGLTRLGPDMVFNLPDYNTISFCFVDEEDWPIGQGLNGRISTKYNLIPMEFISDD